MATAPRTGSAGFGAHRVCRRLPADDFEVVAWTR